MLGIRTSTRSTLGPRFSLSRKRCAPNQFRLLQINDACTISKAKNAELRPKKTTRLVGKLATQPFSSVRFCANTAQQEAAKPPFSILEWKRTTIQRLKAKKAQVLVEYGSTFIFLHETLGIASYLACFGIAHMGLVNMDDILSYIPVLPDHIKDYIAVKSDGIATTAVTALVLLKCLDWMGLTPFRWFLAITLTPRIAWWVGPKVDAVTDKVKSFFPKRAVTPPSSDSTSETLVNPIPENVEEAKTSPTSDKSL